MSQAEVERKDKESWDDNERDVQMEVGESVQMQGEMDAWIGVWVFSVNDEISMQWEDDTGQDLVKQEPTIVVMNPKATNRNGTHGIHLTGT